ncbi:MAG: hypothetical protein M9890_03145 [Thermomicrobiales bacterium]|nr:hypothetical protein [Thermomicrobiales bacterium]
MKQSQVIDTAGHSRGRRCPVVDSAWQYEQVPVFVAHVPNSVNERIGCDVLYATTAG